MDKEWVFAPVCIFLRISFRYLFDIGNEDSAKGGTHEAVDEKVDTGVESDEKVWDRYTDEGPIWNAKAAISDGRSYNFEGQHLVYIQDDAKGMATNEENDNGKKQDSLTGFLGFLGGGYSVGGTWSISHSSPSTNLKFLY